MRECQTDLLRFARKRGIPVDTPWRDLSAAERAWVIDGEGEWKRNVWYGVRRFFAWLETKAYKMHIRVLLSRYRSYTECPACKGSRLKPDALLWRVGDPGLNIRELALMPIDSLRHWFDALTLPPPLDLAGELLLGEIRARLRYLGDVGVGYLNLDRQSRTFERRRSAAHQPDDGARDLAGQHLVRAGRTLDRFARARRGSHRRHHAPPAGQGKHARRRRTRSESDPGGKPDSRCRAGTWRAWWRDRLLRVARGTWQSNPLADRRLSVWPPPCRRAAYPRAGIRRRAAPDGRRGAQSERHRCRHSAQPSGCA